MFVGATTDISTNGTADVVGATTGTSTTTDVVGATTDTSGTTDVVVVAYLKQKICKKIVISRPWTIDVAIYRRQKCLQFVLPFNRMLL